MKNKLKKVCGIWFGYGSWFGNCFAPALVLENRGKQRTGAHFILTLRTRFGLETTVYWDGRFRFWWNSAHLARWFGTFHDTDFGGYKQWRRHIDL